MNFLAHAYLSGEDEKILLGNFIGDFIKGRQALSRFEADVVKGVELHRAIDEFTDNHPVVHESKHRLRPKYRHYAGVIVDVFYDHFLATHWEALHHRSLRDFALETYKTIGRFSDILPPAFKQMLPHMIRGNWLAGYAEVRGVHVALSGMAARTPYDSKMEEASEDLQLHYDQFQDEFQRFFPQLKKFTWQWLLSGKPSS
jgi:acyl carrier protein phosphodiesterase